MSVLSFPHIYFNGYMEWDPATANNNDVLPTYNTPASDLDWDFLGDPSQSGFPTLPFSLPPSTPSEWATFRECFRDWATTAQPADGQALDMAFPARWNYFGGNLCQLTHEAAHGDYKTSIVGGQLEPAQPLASDPLIGLPVTLTGRLIDVNPNSSWTSQIYLSSLTIGSGDASITVRDVERSERMYSRLLFVPRNLNYQLIASFIGAIFQASFSADQLTFNNASQSPLLAALE